MKEDVWKSFFRKLLGWYLATSLKDKIRENGFVKAFFCKLAGWHLPTSLQINFLTDSFQGFKYLLKVH